MRELTLIRVSKECRKSLEAWRGGVKFLCETKREMPRNHKIRPRATEQRHCKLYQVVAVVKQEHQGSERLQSRHAISRDFFTDALGKGTNISELKESPYTTHAFSGGPHRPMNPLDNTLNAERVRPAVRVEPSGR